MSNADSQVKTVSLVIFVLLTIVTSSLAYYFWSQTDLLTQQASEAKKRESEANTKAATAKKEYEDLRSAVGVDPKENHETVMKLANADLQNPKLNDKRKSQKGAYQHFADALKYVQNELASSDKLVEGLQQENVALKNELKATKERYDAEVAKRDQAVDSKTKELASESAKFLAQNSQKDQELEEQRNQMLFYRDQNEQLRRDIEGWDKKYATLLAQSQGIIDSLKTNLNRRQSIQFEHKDGEVIIVNEGGTEAQIDLGLDDGIRKGLTFGVYGRDVGGNPYQLPKADAEVVRITGPHRAIIRVSSNEITNPVLPGDLLYNPIWSRGDKESVAIIGKIYMDGDDEPDNDKFIKLVEQYGGKVDSYVDVKTGQIKGGDISTKTGWLVVGDVPQPGDKQAGSRDEKVDKAIFDNSDVLRRKARESGVRIINARNFLTYMGNQTQTQTVPAGREYQYFYGKKRDRLVDKLQEDEPKTETPPASSTARPGKN